VIKLPKNDHLIGEYKLTFSNATIEFVYKGNI